jgi:hypothetical protein
LLYLNRNGAHILQQPTDVFGSGLSICMQH